MRRAGPTRRRPKAGRGLGRALGLVLSLAVALGCSDRSPPPAPAGRADASWPNVLLISIDTLRPDHLGCYGYGRPTSPRIDALAAAGAVFENALSSTSWTLPAHCALFTGLPDSVHGCQEMNQRLAVSRWTLAERLQAAGYATAGFFSGPALHPVFGVSQGFDEYEDCTAYAALAARVLEVGQGLDGGVVQAAAQADVTGARVTAAVRSWLDRTAARPFFAFVHYWDPHFDFIPPAPYDTMFDPDYRGSITGRGFFIDPAVHAGMPARDLEHLVALYDGEIAWTDAQVGALLDDLEERGLAANTLVVLVSDHGEEFFEHGRKGHRQTLYDEVIRVPLVFRWATRIPAGRRLAAQASIIDVLPTILELAGAPAPPDLMGRSRAAELTDRAPAGGSIRGPVGSGPEDSIALAELASAGRALRAWRRLDAKLIRDEQTGRSQVFDLAADRGELRPLAPGSAAEKELADAAETIADALEERRDAWPGAGGAPELPAEVREQLRRLGYLSD